MTIRCGYADISLGQLHFRESGAGASLLLFHPAPRSSRLYLPLMEHLSTFRTIAVDLPGFGASCDLPQDASMVAIAQAMVEFLDAMEIESTHVFGLHSGNKVGAALAAGWPQRVRRFVCAGMRHSIIPDAARRNEAMRRYIANKPKAIREDDPQGYEEEQMDILACQRAYDTLYAANYAFDLADSLTKVTAPTLILELAVPSEDHLGSPGRELADRMPNASMKRIDCNDRKLLRERRRALAEILIGFFLVE